MGVTLQLLAYDPSVQPAYQAALHGNEAALRAWLLAYEHDPDPSEVERCRQRLDAIVAIEAPTILLEHHQRALYEARHGPLAGKNIVEANGTWLIEWAIQLHRSADLGTHWDLLHYGLDGARRSRDNAVHWRFRVESPSLFDYALFGHHRTPLVTPAQAEHLTDPEPEAAVEQASSWGALYEPYDAYENDAELTGRIAAALGATSAEELLTTLDRELPEHVYGAEEARDVIDDVRALRADLLAFYRGAADRGHHVRTSWRT